MQKKKYAILAAAILVLVSISAFFYRRSTHVPIFPDMDGGAVSITACWSSCRSVYRKDLSAPEAVGAAMEQLRQLTYNPHKEDVYGPNPGGRVLRLAMQYENQEETRVVALIEGGSVIFPEADACDSKYYCMPAFSVEALWNSFDTPEVLVWEYGEEQTP